MPPLTGACGGVRVRAPVVGEIVGGSRAPQDHGRRGPQMLAPSGAPVGAAAGPSVPSPIAWRERRGTPAHKCGTGRRTHDESGPPEPIAEDDETDEDEEPASLQSESSDGGGDGTGSGSESGGDAEDGSEEGSGDTEEGSSSDSDSGADGDSSESMPKKRTKRASRSSDGRH
ncbi:nucleolar transcription factor 1-like [Camellia sinensis]|uniref:nucleolar transcription factor 1-like n=1 Tax=Camellia sinensis TaxID=4442 RepID=UPI0010356AA5|nr:nucleolar transcription factor 1-like [Camellia sinensis]